jgi:hypothetical protein
VEGSEEEEEVVVVVAVHLEVLQGVHRVVPDLEALLLPVADPEVLHLVIPVSPVAVTDPLERMDYLLSPMVPVRVLVLASRGDSVEVGSLDLSLVGIVGGAVVTMGQLLVETVPLTR